MTAIELTGYVETAIRRLSDDVAYSENGSHAAGIFNKAANAFEKQMAQFTAPVAGRSDLDKRTLGTIIEILAKLPESNREPLNSVIGGAKQVNDPWKKVKHGEDPPVKDLVEGLRKILEVMSKLPTSRSTA